MVEPDDGYLARNAAELARLRALAARVLSGGLWPQLPEGWTAPALLAHLAFWDRFVIARWDRYDREGVIENLPDAAQDLINQAGLPLWRALSTGAAVVQALDAAARVCARIAALSPDAVAIALRSDRHWMLDRTHHWSPHLDELARDRPAR